MRQVFSTQWQETYHTGFLVLLNQSGIIQIFDSRLLEAMIKIHSPNRLKMQILNSMKAFKVRDLLNLISES